MLVAFPSWGGVLSVRFRAYMHDLVSVRESDVGAASSYFYIFVVECYTVVAFSFLNSFLKSIDLKHFCSFGEALFLLVAFSFPNYQIPFKRALI